MTEQPNHSCMSSLLEKWHPVTHDFGLIQAPLDRLVAELEGWHRPLGIEYSRSDITSSLGEGFQSLLPLAMSKARKLYVQTDSDWVACFQNGIQGSDPGPAMCYLAGRMGVLAMRVCCTPDTAVYPGIVWEVFAPQSLGGCPPLGYRRSICALNDGGRWVFEEFGERYPFELPERYSLRRKRDRFTREMIRDYLRHFGVELFSDDFLRVSSARPAALLQQLTGGWRTPAPEFTLEEVVAGAPWQKHPES